MVELRVNASLIKDEMKINKVTTPSFIQSLEHNPIHIPVLIYIIYRVMMFDKNPLRNQLGCQGRDTK